MWKSTDKGETWSRLDATVGVEAFRAVNRIIVDPSNENIVVVAADRGIYRSTDGGASFTQVYEDTGPTGINQGEVQQVVATPGNFSVQYAGVNARGILKSTDGGVNWARICPQAVPGGRVEIAVSTADPNWIYASMEGSSSPSQLYISSNAGSTCGLVADEGIQPDWLSGQGWYDNAIVGDPFDVRRVLVAGPEIWEINLSQTQSEQEGLTGMDIDEVSSFLTFVSFTDGALPGLGLGPEEGAIGITEDDFSTVEIRWGPGRSQMAHRFTVPDGATSGVPPSDYVYQDYVQVPFEVWDVDNNRQLMASFRDQQNDGQFNLLSETEQGREYVFVEAIPYNASAPDPSIANNAGHVNKLIYFLWFISNGQWDPGINTELQVHHSVGGPNRYAQYVTADYLGSVQGFR